MERHTHEEDFDPFWHGILAALPTMDPERVAQTSQRFEALFEGMRAGTNVLTEQDFREVVNDPSTRTILGQYANGCMVDTVNWEAAVELLEKRLRITEDLERSFKED
jgi:hypothetical protein